MNRNDILALNNALGTTFPLDTKLIGMDEAYVGGAPQTAPNGDVLAALTTIVTPTFIEALTAPLKMAEIFGERQLGDRVTSVVQIPFIELSGETSAYGDFNDNSMAESNINWESRQPFEYQNHVKIGTKEIEQAAAMRYDVVSAKTRSSILALNTYQNQTYLYGVDGLKNYGVLNDPSLLPDLVGVNWAGLGALETYNEVLKIYSELVTRAKGLVDQASPMTMLVSPAINAALLQANEFGLTPMKYIKDNLPNLKFEVVPQYDTDAGEKIQLILDSYQGQKTVELAYTSKLMTGAVEVKTTGWLQKRSQSSLGAIIYYPQFIVGYLGAVTP